MLDNFVESTIRRLNIRTLLISLAGLLVVFAGLAINTRYLYNMFLGPFPLERNKLLTLSNTGDLFQYYVTVQGDDHGDTGFTYVSTSDSGTETIEYYYHALLFGRRVLLVKSKSAEIQNEQIGALVNLTPDIQKDLIDKLEQEIPELKGKFLPIMLDTVNFHTNGYIGLAIAALVGLLSGLGMLLALYRLLNSQAHPALKKLSRFGSLDAVSNEIDMEMIQPHEQVGKKLHFTHRWLVSTTSSLEVVPYRDILWCYMQVTQHRTNGIPTGKTYTALIFNRYGGNISIQGKEKFVNEILQAVVRFAPGTVVGYSDEIVNLWKNNLAGFAKAVDERRQSSR